MAKYLNEPYDPERAWEQMRHATDIAGRTTSPLRFRCQPCLEPRVEQVGGGEEWPMVNGKLANFTKTNAYKWRDWYVGTEYYAKCKRRGLRLREPVKERMTTNGPTRMAVKPNK